MPYWTKEQLAYCSNVHAGVTPAAIEANLQNITVKIRQQRGLARMQVGLWINQHAAEAYRSDKVLNKLKAVLAEQQLDVVTLNGFPQNDFHETVVKEKVYLPTWAEKSRLNYTLHISHILAHCMPEDITEGTISTLPLAYRKNWNESYHQEACKQLCHYAKAMAELEHETSKHIRLCLEMEPGCVLENTGQLIEFFTQDLPFMAKHEGVELCLIERYLGVCFDVCHQAVMQEDIQESISQLHQAGIIIGKVQISSALKIENPENAKIRAILQSFAEPKYLHQLSTVDNNNQFVFSDDLSIALAQDDFPTNSPWCCHFHLPIQIDKLTINGQVVEGISTTQKSIEQLCDYFVSTLPYAPHLEVETYTWQVLPNAVKNHDDLVGSIVNELSWFEEALAKRNLLTTKNQTD